MGRDADGWVTIGTNLDTEQIDKQLDLLYGKLERLHSEYEALESEPAYEGQAEDLMKINSEIDATTSKIRRLVKEKDKINNPPNDILNWLKKFGKETEKSARKVVNIGLAFIGIRSVYGFLSSSMSTLSNYNEQLAKDIQYIKFALATTLKPVIEGLVQLTYKLLMYVGYIAKAWFGVNIFANASADAMNKANKSAKSLKKQLAGFDEMNILSDTSTDSDTNSAVLPSFDLSQQNIDPPKWLVWIGKHGKEIISIITGIAMAIALVRMGFDLITASGIGLVVAGIVYAVMNLLEYLKDPSWKSFGGIIQGIGIAVIGLGIAFLGLPGIVAGVIVLIFGTIVKYWDKIKEFLIGIVNYFDESIELVKSVFGEQIGTIYEIFVNALKLMLIGVDGMIKAIRTIFDGFIMFFKGIFTGDWNMAVQGLKQIFLGAFEFIIARAKYYLGLIGGIFLSLGQTIGYTLSDFFKMVINQIINRIESILNSPIKAINGIIKAGRKLGVNVDYVSTFKLPRLAKGGIINMPGRGVNYGGANIGERGKEGIIPLTDSQQMAMLGEAIGKYITINANITNNMNGKVISRELQKISAENDFAYNK